MVNICMGHLPMCVGIVPEGSLHQSGREMTHEAARGSVKMHMKLHGGLTKVMAESLSPHVACQQQCASFS